MIHVVAVLLTRKGPWLNLSQLLSLSLVPMLTKLLPSLTLSLLENMVSLPQTCHLGVSDLLKLSGREFVGELVDKMSEILRGKEALQVTSDDMEIAATPTNQLWNPQLNKV